MERFKPKLTVDRFNWLPKQFQIIVFCFFTQKIVVVLTFKNVCFLNKQRLVEICHKLSLNLVNL